MTAMHAILLATPVDALSGVAAGAFFTLAGVIVGAVVTDRLKRGLPPISLPKREEKPTSTGETPKPSKPPRIES